MKGGRGRWWGKRGAGGGGSSLKEVFVATRNNFPLILCTASLTQRDNNDEKDDSGSALILVKFDIAHWCAIFHCYLGQSIKKPNDQ